MVKMGVVDDDLTKENDLENVFFGRGEAFSKIC